MKLKSFDFMAVLVVFITFILLNVRNYDPMDPNVHNT